LSDRTTVVAFSTTLSNRLSIHIMAGMFSKVKGQFGAFGGARDEAATNEAANAKKADEEGDSLTTVLPTDEDRAALTLLVCDCTEVMRQNVVDIFDAKHTGHQYDTVTNMEPVTGDQAVANPEVDSATDASAKEKVKKELERREKEVNSPKMQELKKSALTYFDDWRDHVILWSTQRRRRRSKRTNPNLGLRGRLLRAPRSLPPKLGKTRMWLKRWPGCILLSTTRSRSCHERRGLWF
jgi:hypothetical protein